MSQILLQSKLPLIMRKNVPQGQVSTNPLTLSIGKHTLTAIATHSGATVTAQISITVDSPGISMVVPTSGTSVNGTAQGVNPTDYGVAVYINVNGWWTKPYFASPVTPINADGTWTCAIVTGGNDASATQVAAFLIPLVYSPPALGGDANLPQELYTNSVANIIQNRTL